jgi:hypothetical protein
MDRGIGLAVRRRTSFQQALYARIELQTFVARLDFVLWLYQSDLPPRIEAKPYSSTLKAGLLVRTDDVGVESVKTNRRRRKTCTGVFPIASSFIGDRP